MRGPGRGEGFPKAGSVMARAWTLAAGLLLLVAASTGSRVKRIVGGKPAELPPRLERSTSPAPPPSPTPPPPPTPPATTAAPLAVVKKDRRRAVVNGLTNPDGSASFLGLRYADPPINRLRFQRPRRRKLKGVIEAKQYGPPCPQWFRGRLIGSEDCLFLNIYTPGLPKGDGSPPPRYPVMVWLHGGNFKTGSGNQYLPRDIVKKGVVVVTVQYRLGSLGYLSLGRKILPGNVGLFDQAAAIRWVKDYVRFFGGDPRNIKVAGQGSGASCAHGLTTYRDTRKYIRGAYLMSGTGVSPFTLDENEVRTANEAAELDGCKNQDDMKFVRCMQELPLETIMKGDLGIEDNREKRYESNFAKGLSNTLTPAPVEEGKDDGRFLPHFMTESPFEAMKKGNFSSIPLLIGVTKDETGGGVKGNFLSKIQNLITQSTSFLQGDIFRNCLEANTGLYVNKTVNSGLSKLFSSSEYIQFLTNLVSVGLDQLGQVIQHTTDALFNLPVFITSQLWSKKNKVYVYSFEHKGKSHASKFLHGIPLVRSAEEESQEESCHHGDDLIYLFDLQTLEGQPIENAITLSDADIKVRNHYTTMVAEFARSGVPKTEGGAEWKPFTKEDGDYMIIKEEPTLGKEFRKCFMGLWTGDTDILTKCNLEQATKIVTDTLGSAGTQLLTAVNSVEGRVGSTVEGVASGVNKAEQQAATAITNTTKGVLNALNPIEGSSGILPGSPSKEGSSGILSGSGLGLPLRGSSNNNRPTKKPSGGFGFSSLF